MPEAKEVKEVVTMTCDTCKVGKDSSVVSRSDSGVQICDDCAAEKAKNQKGGKK